MEEIRRQVTRAHRRMVLQQFLGVFVWSMFAALIVALVGVAIPKIWVMNVNAEIWNWSWIVGAIAGGIVMAMVWTYLIRRQPLEAAVEIDRRFGLKERVSSSLALQPDELESDAGHALMTDAARRVERIDIRERFGVSLNWRALLPVIPVIAVVAVLFLENPVAKKEALAKQEQLKIEKRIKTANDRVKKKLEEARKKASENNLKVAEVLFNKLQDKLDKLSNQKTKASRKDAMVRLNDLKKEIEDRQKQLGDAGQMKKNLDQLKDIQKGPADKAVDAMKEGNFKKAMEEINKLAQQLKNGEMSKDDMKDLANQLEEMSKKLNDLAVAHEQAKKDLQEQIKKAERDGNLAKAGDLQQKLDEMKQRDKQMNKLQEMANKLAQCKECMNPGNGGQPSKQQLAQAADALAELGEQLEQMQGEMDELAALDEVMDQIAEAKNGMMCEGCDGAGCKMCNGGGEGDMPGMGMGEGQGQGERPEQETDSQSYLSRVGAKPKKGQAIRTGQIDGLNATGLSKEQVKAEVRSSLSQEADPLTNQRLPKAQREHAKKFFQALRKGE